MFRNKNIINSFWNIADIFLYPLLFFISTSFFIKHLGKEQFGIWMLVNTIVVSMQLFNLGIGSMVLKNIALYIGKRDEEGKTGIMNNAISITIVLFAFCILLSLIGSFLVSHYHLFEIAADYRQLCAKSCALAGCIVGIKFFEQIFTNYFKALEQYKIAALLGSGNRLGGLLLNVLLLALFPFNITQLLLVIIIVNGLFIPFAFVLMKRSLPGYSFRFNLKIPKNEISFAVLTWLQSLVIILTFQSDRYLIVNYFGLVVLSYYALIATMFNHLHMGFSAILHWISPKFTKMYAQELNSEELYMAAKNVVTSCAVISLLILYITYPYIFRIILGTETASEVHEYTKYFISFESFFVLSIVPTYYFNAVGHERTYLYYVLFFCVLALTGMFTCVYIFQQPVAVLYGLIGACAASMIVLEMLLNKILTGNFQLLSCIVRMLPSIFLSAFIFLSDPLLQWSSALLAILTLYLTHVKGYRHKILLLVKS
ncbi:Membrane protein involved in the export of O-antigen and teichoic acid [Chitinophaga sp. YR573]|uniref:lipopolysaccharide biosynthesis protein n=1 Tax=Chitinophaga sp. YR573 TaxID=1881040 RepID=UPI0008BD23AB|nr:hypothetical protein [Chitinophaga sp. YR573]SEW44838.1 Membrane protein involved in the export of O-antigen and teichoic acid [Chitinophaga sp. YR573]